MNGVWERQRRDALSYLAGLFVPPHRLWECLSAQRLEPPHDTAVVHDVHGGLRHQAFNMLLDGLQLKSIPNDTYTHKFRVVHIYA